MERLKITDNKQEIRTIGKYIYETYSDIYTERMKCLLDDELNNYLVDKNREIKNDFLYRSIYDYWVYGVSIKQFFFYQFSNKTHQEKSEYLTQRNRFPYVYYLNEKNNWHILENKYEAYSLLKEYYNREVIRIASKDDEDSFVKFANAHTEFIVKPAGLGCGIGVHRVSVSDFANLKQLFDYLIQIGENAKKGYGHWKHVDINTDVILEEVIVENPDISVIHPFSLNPFRITTVLGDENDVHFFYPRITLGNNKEYITNASSGSLVAGINAETGIIETNGFSEYCEEFEEHPISHIKIKGFRIPHWEEMKLMLTEAARRLPSIRYVGWDVVLSDKGWCIMEGNFMGEFTGQVAYGRGFKKEFENLIGWKDNNQFWWES